MRSNRGGLLDQAQSVAEVFIGDGVIFSTQGRHPDSQRTYRSGSRKTAELPVVVLVNGNSASAAEIVAAALQDAGRAVVVGSSSYGKGTVQTVIRLPNDGELTLTWAKLVTPAGYVLHEHGVVPTICTSGIADKEPDIAAALRRGLSVPPASTPAGRPRAALDERAWTDLRKTCPAANDEHGADLQIAKRLVGNAALYARALHPEGPSLAHSGERSP
jgi:carboxyl-terminal processing protease